MSVEPVMLRLTTVSWLRCNGRLRNAPLPRIVDSSRSLEDELVCEILSACMDRIRWVLLWFSGAL